MIATSRALAVTAATLALALPTGTALAAPAPVELGTPLPQAHAHHDYVAGAHRDGYRVRFWATNDIAGEARTNLWLELRDAGVDHINTDDLEGLQEFLAQE